MNKLLILIVAFAITGCSLAMETCPLQLGVGYDYTGNSGFNYEGSLDPLFQGGILCNVSDQITVDAFYIDNVRRSGNAWGEVWAVYHMGGRPATQIDLKRPATVKGELP